MNTKSPLRQHFEDKEIMIEQKSFAFKETNLWDWVLVGLAILLVPSLLSNCSIFLVALAWTTRPIEQFWRFPQYAWAFFGMLAPWLYWASFWWMRKKPWARISLVLLGILSIVAYPLLDLANNLGLTH